MALEWPYWILSFPVEMTDLGADELDTMVCGEHELLSVISDRVRQHEYAGETAAALMEHLRRGPPPSAES